MDVAEFAEILEGGVVVWLVLLVYFKVVVVGDGYSENVRQSVG